MYQNTGVILSWIVSLGALIVGCDGRPNLIPVHGTVLYQGEPLSGARVEFHPEEGQLPAAGLTDSDGRYELTTFETGDGAVPGKYGVAVFLVRQIDSEPLGDTSGPAYQQALENAAKAQSEIDEKLPREFGRPETSGLVKEVRPGEPNVIDLDLTD